MTNEEAKSILALYRPGTADRTDPAFAAAFALTNPPASPERWQTPHDPELGRWFLEHRSSYLSVRGKFQQIPVPNELLDRILNEPHPAPEKVIRFQPMLLLQIAAVIVLCVGLAALFHRPPPPPAPLTEFETYRGKMSTTALMPYNMELETNNLAALNAFLAGRKAPSDFVLPQGMTNAIPVGCAVVLWQGAPVSMVCFRSGKPLTNGDKSDLWLFVINQTIRTGPTNSQPVISQVNALNRDVMTASWTQTGKTYILAVIGDQSLLSKFE